MATFMDVHEGMKGITKEQLESEHRKDLEIEGAEGVHFIKAWADPKSGKVFCLSEGPSMDAVRRVHEKAGHPASEVNEVSFSVE
jgi:ferredoxin-NADP reductase